MISQGTCENFSQEIKNMIYFSFVFLLFVHLYWKGAVQKKKEMASNIHVYISC